MRTHQYTTGLPERERTTGLESVTFHDGMVVTAEDMETASQYPVSLLRTVLRAYLGCGVVCGLGLSSTRKLEGEPPWVVRVDPGLAVDCHGYPVDLVCPVELDFTPDPCARDELPQRAYIAVRRLTSDEVRSTPCDCVDHRAEEDCTRVRERVLVRAFTGEQLDELAGGACEHLKARRDDCREKAAPQDTADRAGSAGPAAAASGTGDRGGPGTDTDWCSVLKQCSCSCDGEWVVLGSVALSEREGVLDVDHRGRRWVKPTEAYCALECEPAPAPEPVDEERMRKLEDTVARLAETVARLEKELQDLKDARPPVIG